MPNVRGVNYVKAAATTAKPYIDRLLDTAEIPTSPPAIRELFGEFILKRWGLMPFVPGTDAIENILTENLSIGYYPITVPPYGTGEWQRYYERVLEEAAHPCVKRYFSSKAGGLLEKGSAFWTNLGQAERETDPETKSFLRSNVGVQAAVLSDGFVECKYFAGSFVIEDGNLVGVYDTPEGDRFKDCAGSIAEEEARRLERRKSPAVAAAIADIHRLLDAAELGESDVREYFVNYILKRWGLEHAYGQFLTMISASSHSIVLVPLWGSPEWTAFYGGLLEEAGHACTREYFEKKRQELSNGIAELRATKDEDIRLALTSQAAGYADLLACGFFKSLSENIVFQGKTAVGIRPVDIPRFPRCNALLKANPLRIPGLTPLASVRSLTNSVVRPFAILKQQGNTERRLNIAAKAFVSDRTTRRKALAEKAMKNVLAPLDAANAQNVLKNILANKFNVRKDQGRFVELANKYIRQLNTVQPGPVEPVLGMNRFKSLAKNYVDSVRKTQKKKTKRNATNVAPMATFLRQNGMNADGKAMESFSREIDAYLAANPPKKGFLSRLKFW